MNIIQIGIIGIICVILITTIRKENPQIAILLSLGGGMLIIFNVLGSLKSVISIVEEIAKNIDVNFKYILMIIKIIGISYIAEFCSQICIDAGEGAIASKIEIGAKVFIVVASLPVLSGLMQMINSLLI